MGAVLLLAVSLALAVYGLMLRLPRYSPRRAMLRQLGAHRPSEPESPLARRLSLVAATRDVSPRRFRQLQWLLAGAGALLVTVPWLMPTAVPDWGALCLYPVAGWCLPELWLRVQLHRRRGLLARSYPDLLSHLSIQMRAGAHTLQAFASSPPVLREPLRGEVELLVADLKLSPFAEALQRFAERCDTPAIRAFAAHATHQLALGMTLPDLLAAEEAHVLAMARQGARQRIQRSAIVMAAVTVILLCNGLLVYFTPVLYDLTRFLARP